VISKSFDDLLRVCLEREISIQQNYHHPNIVKYPGNFIENEDVCIVMKYFESGYFKEFIC
jgi:serine/threonine protein kinase